MIRKTLSSLLHKLGDDIENGNCNMTEEEMVQIFEHIKTINDNNSYLSKYEACQYLHVSRPTFDRMVAEGKIPQGKKRAGLKELLWEKCKLKM